MRNGKIKITPKKEEKSKQERIYGELRISIMKNELKMGSLLSERDLSLQFNTSRTPVREAIKQLEFDGLVEIIPHRGIRITSISFDDIFEIYEVRAGLDPIATRLFIYKKTEDKILELEKCMDLYEQASIEGNISLATKHNMNFHLIIARGSANSRLIKYQTHLINQCHRAILHNIINIQQQDISVEEHKNVLYHIKKGNVVEAENAARDHILMGISYQADVYKKYFTDLK
jgi:DNA-binding GntR family transcriptional regulator